MTAYEILRRRVLEYVATKKIGPAELARRLGYTDRSWGSHFMKDNRKIDIKHLDRVAALLGVSVSSLFDDDDSLSTGALAVAHAYQRCQSEQLQTIVHNALGLPLPIDQPEKASGRWKPNGPSARRGEKGGR